MTLLKAYKNLVADVIQDMLFLEVITCNISQKQTVREIGQVRKKIVTKVEEIMKSEKPPRLR